MELVPSEAAGDKVLARVEDPHDQRTISLSAGLMRELYPLFFPCVVEHARATART